MVVWDESCEGCENLVEVTKESVRPIYCDECSGSKNHSAKAYQLVLQTIKDHWLIIWSIGIGVLGVVAGVAISEARRDVFTPLPPVLSDSDSFTTEVYLTEVEERGFRERYFRASLENINDGVDRFIHFTVNTPNPPNMRVGDWYRLTLTKIEEE